jgi:hypothetical protein
VSQPLEITSKLDRPPLRFRSDTASYETVTHDKPEGQLAWVAKLLDRSPPEPTPVDVKTKGFRAAQWQKMRRPFPFSSAKFLVR